MKEPTDNVVSDEENQQSNGQQIVPDLTPLLENLSLIDNNENSTIFNDFLTSQQRAVITYPPLIHYQTENHPTIYSFFPIAEDQEPLQASNFLSDLDRYFSNIDSFSLAVVVVIIGTILEVYNQGNNPC